MRVLVVEDDPAIAEVVRRGLTGEGHVVDVERDGAQGLVAATQGSYDVIVLDIMLPRLNGYDVLKHLRSRRVWTPVLMLTAKDGEYDQEDAFDLGADDYLTKPFSLVVLKARLRALQRRGTPERPVTVSAAGIELDPGAHTVTRDGTPVSLTPREFALLEYLLRHPNAALSKTQILQNVWDSAYDGDPNVVEVYIGYLRRKVDAPFGATSIETVRGVGYRLRDDG
ncbi:response regulator transcription factor [Propioniciclava soli]|uniref:Response regulator transcription factor n=1 Tax=Propioniciclava soli TaxID=2775081 RepID=A0ABZ3C9E8_9ACTN|nr:response regulator transcription factor [Propioniciclava soli]